MQWSTYVLHPVVVFSLKHVHCAAYHILFNISQMLSHSSTSTLPLLSYHLIIPVQMLSKTDDILANQSKDNEGPVVLNIKVRMP